jgi:hypothetical protein
MYNDSFINQRRKIMCDENNHNQNKDNSEYITLAYQSTLEDLRVYGVYLSSNPVPEESKRIVCCCVPCVQPMSSLIVTL